MTIMLCSGNMWEIQDLPPFASNSSQRKKNAQFNSDSRLLLCLKAWVRGIP